MKIEKISDTQIRCTLSKQDLAERELKLSELAYGSDKAKALFRELMLQASYECGFEADDIPLMIEAIPISSESLVLVMTKVEDPDELDTRFSNFSSFKEQSGEEPVSSFPSAFADEILECFGQLSELIGRAKEGVSADETTEKETGQPAESAEQTAPVALAKVFSFPSLKAATSLATVIAPYYFGENTLYKDTAASRYYLVAEMSNHTPEEFNKICNVIAEYGTPERTSYASLSYYAEHYTPVVAKDAVQTLAAL
ncbi:MAG: adaptor protein MecA [Lachnospiraceae bacterium]